MLISREELPKVGADKGQSRLLAGEGRQTGFSGQGHPVEVAGLGTGLVGRRPEAAAAAGIRSVRSGVELFGEQVEVVGGETGEQSFKIIFPSLFISEDSPFPLHTKKPKKRIWLLWKTKNVQMSKSGKNHDAFHLRFILNVNRPERNFTGRAVQEVLSLSLFHMQSINAAYQFDSFLRNVPGIPDGSPNLAER